MEVKCEYCGSMIPDDASHCPNCGGVNTNVNRTVKGTPRTIKELQDWYQARGLPPYEITRFFIGINCKEPKVLEFIKMATDLLFIRTNPMEVVQLDIMAQMKIMPLTKYI